MTENEFAWRPIVISPNATIRKSLLAVLKERCPDRTVISEYAAEAAVLEFMDTKRANVCFVDVCTDESRALGLIRELASTGLTIVAFHSGTEPGLILRCLRCG